MPMFREECIEEKGLNWEDMSPKDVMNYLTYEIFFCDITQQDVMEEIEDLGVLKEEELVYISEELLVGKVYRAYKKTWRGLVAAEEPRILLFGEYDRNKRKFHDKESDIAYLLDLCERLKLERKIKENLEITIYDSAMTPMMKVRPCCPDCYTILPENWFTSDDYYTISLVAPPAGGKTTLLCSWLCNNMDIFNTLQQMGKNYSVARGITDPINTFKIQSVFIEMANKIEKNEDYPEVTEKISIPPMYLEIHKNIVDQNSRVLLVGVYDCSGEVLRKAADETNRAALFLKSMDAFIYLVSPEQMKGIDGIEGDNQEDNIEVNDSMVFALEEQGQYQMDHGYDKILAEDLLENAENNRQDAWEIYNMLANLFVRENTYNPKKRHMAYTIIKSDKLKDRPELDDIRGHELLFRDARPDEVSNENCRLQINTLVKTIFKRFVLSGTEEEKQDFLEQMETRFCQDDESGDYISWHCVCAARDMNRGHKYTSCRKADPLVGCLLKKLESL